MLQRDENGKPTPKTKLHGFLTGVEVSEGVDLQSIINHISDALAFMEGVGRSDTEWLGEIELVPVQPQPNLIVEGTC